MKNREGAADILRTLRLNLPVDKSVTCKVRLLAEPRDTVEFCQMAERCGVTAVAVHGRTRDQREQHAADWSQVALVKSALSCPVVLNGDVFCFEDFGKALRETGADAVMTARGALANVSIFSEQGEDVLEVAKKYVALAMRESNHYANTKWTVLRMLGGVSRKEKTHKDLMESITNCRDYEGLVPLLSSKVVGETEPKRQRL